MYLVLQYIVFLGEIQHLVQLFFESLVLLAQGQYLSFGKRNGASAIGMGNGDFRQHLGVGIKKLRVILQKLCDIFGSHCVTFIWLVYKLISPLYTLIAGPVISTGVPSPAHLMFNIPPLVATCTRSSSSPRLMPVTTAAHAPVPQ